MSGHPTFPPVHPSVKSISHFLKVASEHDGRDIVVSYWARMFACERAMAMIPGKDKPKEVTDLLTALMTWMEKVKRENPDHEGLKSDVVAQSMIEQYALQLFSYGDTQDRESNFGKNTIKAFYTAGILMDILEQFGPLTDDIHGKRKYAKWKAAYIHNCLKTGDVPLPGAMEEHEGLVVHRSQFEKNKENDYDDDLNELKIDLPPKPAEPAKISPTEPAKSPVTPSPAPPANNWQPSSQVSSAPASGLSPSEVQEAQKCCKYANSSLDYDDVNAAVNFLEKALRILKGSREKASS